MSYSTILVPVDFSELNEKALAKAKDLKRDSDCSITLVHAVDYMPPPHMGAQLPEIYASTPLMIERAEKHMHDLQEKLDLTDATVIVKAGKARDVVIEVQNEINADLIIMAKHSHKGLERLLGSTTNGVANKAVCDLLVIPE